MRAARQCRFAGRRAVLLAGPRRHPWLRINRVLRVMLQTHWNAEAWSVVRIEFKKALAVRSEIQRAGWSSTRTCPGPARAAATVRP